MSTWKGRKRLLNKPEWKREKAKKKRYSRKHHTMRRVGRQMNVFIFSEMHFIWRTPIQRKIILSLRILKKIP
ncbi:unnamed protein product [Callosobruchus maculatus]|uniref:Uncharacterized protein n=1 Tax=Callosobruchus maculatus TaxID=64391 RepID=A0A653DY04_CALMS|nr:unnamed protein product [Callosobruchus maculatus]